MCRGEPPGVPKPAGGFVSNGPYPLRNDSYPYRDDPYLLLNDSYPYRDGSYPFRNDSYPLHAAEMRG